MESKDYIKNIDGAERRFFQSEVRVAAPATTEGNEPEEAPMIIEGYAAKYNTVTTIGGWFEEEILPGAFDDCLNDDIRALFNHDPNFILARTTSKTLTVAADKVGLKYSFTSPDRSYAEDLCDAIKTGDVSESSFAFRVAEENWIIGDSSKGVLDKRQIVKFKTIFDVSPVTYPAYPDTEVAQRSLTSYKKENNIEMIQNRSEENRELSTFEAQILINKNRV